MPFCTLARRGGTPSCCTWAAGPHLTGDGGDAVLVALLAHLADLAQAEGVPTVTDVRPGSYIEMHDDVVTTFALPIRYVDASIANDIPNDSGTDGAPWWLSGLDLHADAATAHDRFVMGPTTVEPG